MAAVAGGSELKRVAQLDCPFQDRKTQNCRSIRLNKFCGVILLREMLGLLIHQNKHKLSQKLKSELNVVKSIFFRKN
jgi:hypothetical protein